jgi:hypothetical protein
MNTIYKHEPYFYIIQHTKSGLLYAGCRYSKLTRSNYTTIGCNPVEFMKIDGYKTSSKKVHTLIEMGGIDSFKIIQLIPEQCCGTDVYTYETLFLQKYNVAQRSNWINCHNNTQIKSNTHNDSKWYTDKFVEYRVKRGETPPIGWHVGRLNLYTDGKLEGRYPLDKIPYGWYRGRKLTKTTGSKWFTNGKLDKKIFGDDNIPEGWYPGRSVILSGNKYYNNGVYTKSFKDNDTIPEGWVAGNIKGTDAKLGGRMYTNGEIQIIVKIGANPPDGWHLGGAIGKYWINNGVFQKLLKPGELIETGWCVGKLHTENKRAGLKYYNNGKESMLLSSDDTIPENWVIGKLDSENWAKKSKWYNNGVTNKRISVDDVPFGWEIGRCGYKRQIKAVC